MNDEIGLSEDIEPTDDTTEGVKGGAAPGSKQAALDAAAAIAAKEATPLGSSATIAVDPLASSTK
ncbi:MAG: hypothetical protein ABSD82_13980 [Solirubrobacteraceae bacterium]|jgi:hypothetical protein